MQGFEEDYQPPKLPSYRKGFEGLKQGLAEYIEKYSPVTLESVETPKSLGGRYKGVNNMSMTIWAIQDRTGNPYLELFWENIINQDRTLTIRIPVNSSNWSDAFHFVYDLSDGISNEEMDFTMLSNEDFQENLGTVLQQYDLPGALISYTGEGEMIDEEPDGEIEFHSGEEPEKTSVTNTKSLSKEELLDMREDALARNDREEWERITALLAEMNESSDWKFGRIKGFKDFF
jgi:hypothetical protein